jgi:lipoprotein-anchoring transpeptidase ErfK/SrfK
LTAVLGATASLRRASLVAVVVVGATAACVGERPTLAPEPSPTAPADETTSTVQDPQVRVAQATVSSIDLFDDATAASPSRQLTTEEATATPGIPMVFLVEAEMGDRLEVHLPTPPAGDTAWVRRVDVTVSIVTHRVEIALGEHRLRVLDGERTVLDEAVSVGTDRPPAGSYYVKELLQAPDPDGPYGAYAYGLSGYSTSLTGFAQGEGVVGFHGTDDPASIGQDVTTGCIGLSAEVLDRLVDEVGLPLGTPVTVVD